MSNYYSSSRKNRGEEERCSAVSEEEFKGTIDSVRCGGSSYDACRQLVGRVCATSWRIFIVPSSRKEFDIGLRAFQGDEPKGRQQIEKAIDEAQKSNPPTGDTVARPA